MSSSSFISQSIDGKFDDEYIESLLIPYEEIKSATNNFDDENLIAQGSSLVYKGQLLNSDGQLINIVARLCPQLRVVTNELLISRFLNHKNISSTFKVCQFYDDDDDDRFIIMINKHEANGSLDKHLSGSSLTWIQRLKICLAVARALSYIHYHGLDKGDPYYIIHGNIKSSKILLDHNWEPKLHGFGFAQIVKRNTSGYFASKYNGTLQYMDPTYENTKTLTYKSDVFSFGVVLFEVLFGTLASIQNEDHWYFARLARLRYEEGTLDGMIDPDLRKQMDLQSLKIFSETAYYCLKEQKIERPDMNQIVKRLEKALELQQKHQTPPEHSRDTIGNILSNKLKGKKLDHLKIRLCDIETATNKFSIASCIGQGGYGRVYKAELDHFDSTKSSEGNNKGDFFYRRSIVAIKRLFSRQDGQEEQGFSTEIEMLINCKHPNIVSLLGFCEEGLERILIYEYVVNGSLNKYLANVDNIINLTWGRRIQICLDIAKGLNYLHTKTEEKEMIIHRDIKSDNILLDDDWVAKIADFGLSKLRPADLKGSTINTVNIAGTDVYLDPEYIKTGKLKKESDIYSFGVVLFEIMCGRVAYDEIYYANNDNGLPSTIRRCFGEGTLENLVDTKLKETDSDDKFMLSGGINQDSLDTFKKIAYQCLANTQRDRPTTKVIIEELEKALDFQKNKMNKFQISLRDIKLATQNFSDDKCIGEGRYWKQYEGEIQHANVCTTIVAKRFDSKSIQGHHQFIGELKALSEYKHDNIVALVGYCNELDEKVIVFEHDFNGSLDKHLDNGSLAWMKRLKICIEVANGLEFLHTRLMIHGDIKSASIVIAGNWKAKISNLELISKMLEHDWEIEHVTGSLSYVDPTYKQHGLVLPFLDVYSLGVVLIEILSGRLVSSYEESLGDLVQKCKQSAEALDKLVFEDIKQHCAPRSLTTFFKLVAACLDLNYDKRPNAEDVVIQLNKALKFQEDYEIWEPKLPKDYKQIIFMSNTPEIYSNKPKKDLYDMLTTKGILLQQGKLWFVLGGNGERNEMISATKFSYRNRSPYRWRSLPESRFHKVAEMLDISNLMIKIKTRPQFLTPNAVYGVHLVFKFCDSRKFSSKPVYVNLKYRKGNETLHTYFATWRDDEWMMIELYRFMNQKEDVFKFLLESLSPWYYGGDAIYVEGIEFRAIENVEHEEVEKLKEVQQVLKLNSNVDKVQQLPIKSEEMFRTSQNYDDGEKLFLSEVNGKKHLILSAKEALYDFSDLKLFNSKPLAESRFQEVIELLPQPVFRINCTIKSQMLSQDTEYACYLVFKLSAKCQGLHCPVEVRDLLHRENKDNKDVELVYFKSPSPWNIHDITRVPTQREDGWMEVNVWKFNSQHEVKNNRIPVKLKLISYEGTMSGLIVCGLEFRPI